MAASNTQLARKAVNEVLSFFNGDDEDVNVNGLDKRNRERIVRAVARALRENQANTMDQNAKPCEHVYSVVVTCDTRHHANRVLAERLGHDENYGFEYTVAWTPDGETIPEFVVCGTRRQRRER